MTKASVQRTTSLALLSATLFCSSAGFASIVYDNSTTDLNRSYMPSVNGVPQNGVEFGDEIFLTGSDRTITEFKFEYFLSANANGNETGQLVLRLNDGAVLSQGRNAPGTAFFTSAPFNLTQTGRGIVDAQGLSVPIPQGTDHFTWTVTLNGIDASEQAGLMLYDPPTKGTSFDDFWQKDGANWNTFLIDGGATHANFAAKITAVPEPSTLALGVFGALGLLGYVGLKRRS